MCAARLECPVGCQSAGFVIPLPEPFGKDDMIGQASLTVMHTDLGAQGTSTPFAVTIDADEKDGNDDGNRWRLCGVTTVN